MIDKCNGLNIGDCCVNRMLRLNEVLKITGLCKSTLYRYISLGQFPRPVKLNPKMGLRGAVGWPESVIEDWLKMLGGKDEH